MNKVKLAVCIGEREYRDRIAGCLMKHYRDQLELHMFESWEQLISAEETFDVRLLGDCEEALAQESEVPTLYLCESGEECALDKSGGIILVEKYQEVNRIVELMLAHAPEVVRQVQDSDRIVETARLAAVYSLSENGYQLPFSVTLGSILGEQGRVLLVDMQENSGFSQVIGDVGELGLEEILVMAENGSYSKRRIASCIGHGNGMDYFFPVENAECLCEADKSTYLRMLTLIRADLGYDVVILNLGSRFSGFAEILKQCDTLYLLQRPSLYQWRENEFVEELERRGCAEVVERLVRVEVPMINYPALSFERLVEQWKWNELGDLIRRMVPQVARHG